MKASTRHRTAQRLTIIAAASAMALIAGTPAFAGGSGGPVTRGTTPATTTLTAAAATSTKVPGNVRLYQTRTSLLGLHKWYQQYKNGRPVVGGWWGWHRNRETGAITIWDGRKGVGKVNATQPAVSAATASNVATKTAASTGYVSRRELMVLPALPSTQEPRLVWAISTADGDGARISYVDAVTGDVLKTTVNTKAAHADEKRTTGTARVFDPNPVAKLQDESLRDQNNAADAVPPAGYTKRNLGHLGGKGRTLVGRWVKVMNKDRASSPTATYTYNRSNPYFEQTMAYYAIDVEQSYLRRIGFTDVNAEQQKIITNTIPDDNSFYDPSADMITMGRGGVDDAEDPEVTWHEYGHAIQDDQIPDWGLRGQGRAIGEGFGDYIAVTMSQQYADDTALVPTACVMDWDATSYTSGTPHCLRRTDTDKVYPDDMVNESHADGEIWSRALWDMNTQLGRNRANRVIVEAQFWMNPKIDFAEAAQVTVDTAAALYPANTSVATITQQAFADRGILPPPVKR